MNRLARAAVIGAMAVMLSACIGGSSPATRFYSLEPAQPTVAVGQIDHRSAVALVVGPVTLPEALNRPHMVIRDGGHLLHLSEFDQWLGNLQDEMTRVVTLRVMERMQSAQVSLYPLPRGRSADYSVRVDVLRLEGRPGVEARMTGNWSVSAQEDEQKTHVQRFDLREPVQGTRHEDLVAAYSRLTLRLADSVVDYVVALPQ